MLGGLFCLLNLANLLVLTSTYLVHALAVNRTIDDQKGDSVTGVVPSYSPIGSWNQGPACTGCFIQLDTSQTFDGTWHDTTHTPGDPEPRVITAQFTGTAVYVYNVLANTVPFTTTFTSITFTLDGTNAGQFIHVPTDSTDFQYNVPVFVQTGLSNTDHTLVIEANGDKNSSLVLFDYIVYTFEDDPPTTTTTSTLSSTSPSPPTSDTPPNTPTVTTSRTDTPTTTSTTTLATSMPPHGTTTSSPNTSSSNPLGAMPAASAGSALASFALGSSGSVPPNPTTTLPVSAAPPPAQDASTVSPGAIVGGVVGGVVVLIAVALLAFCLLRKRRRTRTTEQPHTPALDLNEGQTREIDWSGAAAAPGATLAAGGAHNGSGAALVDPFTSTGAQSGTRPPFQPWPSSSESEGSGYSTSPPVTHNDSPTALLVASSVPTSTDSTRRSRPLPRPSASESGSSNGSGYSPSPLSATSAEAAHSPGFTGIPASTRDLSPLNDPTMQSSSPVPPPSHLDDVKVPLEDARPEERLARLRASLALSQTSSEALSYSTTGTRSLRAQVAALQQEVERLREEREMQRLFEEAPPRYDEA
ncbi:hypothetical protein C8Q77DRAFT_116628 [Trametes polyzona]|nr:hypothetical protein C8Q77DRAFT_116628 [Trametes polyzona]